MEVALRACEHGIPRGYSTIWIGRRNIVMEAEEGKSCRSHRVAMRLETGFPLGKLLAANVVRNSEEE